MEAFSKIDNFSALSVPANWIRQWHYCPRVVYYMTLIDSKSFYQPAWIKQGEDFHKLEEKLWKRRNLSRFNLEKGKRFYNLKMSSAKLSLHGVADMAIETETAVYPVEFKLSAREGKKQGNQLQLTAYALLLEKHFSKPSPVGFITGKGKVLRIVKFDQKRRQALTKAIEEIQQMLRKGLKPESDASIVQCCACEYVNFCNDRL